MTPKTTLAMVLLAALLASGPASAADLDRIQALADRGRTKEALRQVESYLIGQPEQLDGQLLRGVLLADLGRSSEAERAFLLLTRQYPDRPEPVHNLAVMRARAGRPATATRALEGLVTRYPTYETAASNLERIRRTAASGEYDPLTADDPPMQLALTPRARFSAQGPVLADTAAEPPAGPTADVAREQPVEPATSALDMAFGELQPVGRGRAPKPAAEAPAMAPVADPPATGAADTATTETAEAPAMAPVAGPPATAAVDAAMTEPAEAPETRPVAEAAAAAVPDTVSGGPEPAPATAPPAAATDLRAELEAVVTAWAAAWSQQRVKEYLGFYAAGFQPAGQPSRDAWEAVRRQRVAAPSFIEVEIDLDSMTVQPTGPGEAIASFGQSYRSDSYSDTVRKTLGFVREDGEWRILSEASQ